MPGAAVALGDAEWLAGCSGSLELLQPVEMASTVRAPAPIRVIRFHIVIVIVIVIVPFYTSVIP
jgi:hypothetical protein